MSKFITLFQEKKRVEARMRAIKYDRNTEEEYQKLQKEKDKLNEQLNQIIKSESK